MRKSLVLLSSLSLGLLAAGPAAADMYFGAKTGKVMVDGASDPTNASLMLGYELGVVAGDLGIEGEIGTSIDEASNGTEVDTAGAYLAFRTAGPIYLIAKGGAAWRDVKSNGSSNSETNESYGLGLGFSVGLLQLEAEFTRIEDDIDYLSLGIRF